MKKGFTLIELIICLVIIAIITIFIMQIITGNRKTIKSDKQIEQIMKEEPRKKL
jgi:prepilin-type N-terminal cleavage/methylation domain-containing protein